MAEKRDKQVRLVVSEQKLDNWDEYWENDPEYSNRSDLIRKAVAHEMADSDGVVSGPETDELAVQMAEIMDRMDTMMEQFDSVNQRLRSLESEARKDPEMAQLTTRVLEILPTHEDYREYKSEESVPPWLPRKHGGPLAFSGSTESISRGLDISKRKAQRAVNKLQENTHIVRKIEGEDGDAYVRKE